MISIFFSYSCYIYSGAIFHFFRTHVSGPGSSLCVLCSIKAVTLARHGSDQDYFRVGCDHCSGESHWGNHWLAAVEIALLGLHKKQQSLTVTIKAEEVGALRLNIEARRKVEMLLPRLHEMGVLRIVVEES